MILAILLLIFIKDIRGKIADKNVELKNGAITATNGAITATFADALNLISMNIVYTDCDKLKEDLVKNCEQYSNFNILQPGGFTKPVCLEAASRKWDECKKNGEATIQGDPSVLDIFLSYTGSSLILLIAAFTLFAGGIMILFRIIAIWFLVTISPLVFVCYILPGLQNNWKKWWKTFLNWCIFAPAYAFFVWMAIQIAVSGANKRMATEAGQYTFSGQSGALSNPLIANPGGELISYLIIIGFLIGGLIVAKNLGIYGANSNEYCPKSEKGSNRLGKKGSNTKNSICWRQFNAWHRFDTGH